MQRTSDSAWRSGGEQTSPTSASSASYLAGREVHGRTAGPALPLAAGQFQRAVRSGDAPQAQDGQVAVVVHVFRDELRAERHFASGCSGQATPHGDQEPNGQP